MEGRGAREALLREVDLYPVLSGPALSLGRSYEEMMEAVLQGGCRMVQLRMKQGDARDVLELAYRLREKTREAGALLIINDRLDIALACGADGVHLGQSDLPVDVARRLAPELIIGASTHSVEQAVEAQRQGASYANIGPIYPTQTKTGVPRFLGPQVISQVRSKVEIPLTVMGGIKEHHLEGLKAAGARIVAVVTAVTEASDPVAAVRSMRHILTQGASF